MWLVGFEVLIDDCCLGLISGLVSLLGFSGFDCDGLWVLCFALVG